MDIHEYPWISMDIHGHPWIYSDYPWISMDYSHSDLLALGRGVYKERWDPFHVQGAVPRAGVGVPGWGGGGRGVRAWGGAFH